MNARNIGLIILSIVVFAIALSVAVLFLYLKGIPPLFPPHSPSASTTEVALAQSCTGCVTLENNGETLTVAETTRITLILPTLQYAKNTLIITPRGSLGETFGASPPAGMWVRTFEGLAPGTSTITVLPKNKIDPPFVLTLRITPYSQNPSLP